MSSWKTSSTHGTQSPTTILLQSASSSRPTIGRAWWAEWYGAARAGQRPIEINVVVGPWGQPKSDDGPSSITETYKLQPYRPHYALYPSREARVLYWLGVPHVALARLKQNSDPFLRRCRRSTCEAHCWRPTGPAVDQVLQSSGAVVCPLDWGSTICRACQRRRDRVHAGGKRPLTRWVDPRMDSNPEIRGRIVPLKRQCTSCQSK